MNINEVSVQFGKFSADRFADRLVVADERVAGLYGLQGSNVFLLPQGERAKSFDVAESLCDCFLQRNLGKGDVVVAVGGGSVGDVTGFACSVYKRGVVGLLHVPTTLVAMVDSCIGGKTALNLNGVKNAVGSYFFADALVDVRFLQTLDARQITSGMGEILKYRMLDDGVNKLCASAKTEDIVCACAMFKQNVCQRDPYCAGERNKLNFGHTLGHAMELALNIPHGFAVANGIFYETSLALALGLCTEQYAVFWQNEVRSRFEIYPLAVQMLNLTTQDKKNTCGDVCFVLPGDFLPVNVPFGQLKALLQL